MKKIRLFFIGMLTAGALTLAGCGGGGGGNGGGGGDVQPPVANTNFNMVELAGLGGNFSAAVAINEGGLAVGFSDDGDSVKGARWAVGDAFPTASALNPLAGNNYSAAYGINSLNMAVGESGVAIDEVADANTVAVFWPAGSANPVALSSAGLFAGGASAAYAINEAGEIVGEAVNDAEGNTVAVYWADTTADPVILGNLTDDGFGSAYFIGADGLIVGESGNSEGLNQAVVWEPGAGEIFDGPFSLAALANQIGSVAYGADLDGRIVGEVEVAGGAVHGVLWDAVSGSLLSDLGADTSAQAINDVDRVVGYTAALSSNDRAAIWNAANIADFRNLSTVFSHAYALNDHNEIVGLAGNQAVAAIPE